MSAKATNSSKSRMDCDRVAQDDILDRYLASGLSEEDREAFEEHYFGCARCFDDLQVLRTIREELRRGDREIELAPARRFGGWPAAAAGLAAACVLAVGVLLTMRTSAPVVSEPPVSQTTGRQVPEGPQPRPPEPAASASALEQLARVDPPRYEPARLRNVPDAGTVRFQSGMEHYRKADYRGALPDLRAAAELQPDAAHVRFFLGASLLMLGQDSDAIDQLQATVALGDSAYLEEAHFYLAKAFLRRNDLDAADTHLKKVIQLGGAARGAERLLTEIQRLKRRSD